MRACAGALENDEEGHSETTVLCVLAIALDCYLIRFLHGVRYRLHQPVSHHDLHPLVETASHHGYTTCPKNLTFWITNDDSNIWTIPIIGKNWFEVLHYTRHWPDSLIVFDYNQDTD